MDGSANEPQKVRELVGLLHDVMRVRICQLDGGRVQSLPKLIAERCLRRENVEIVLEAPRVCLSIPGFELPDEGVELTSQLARQLGLVLTQELLHFFHIGGVWLSVNLDAYVHKLGNGVGEFSGEGTDTSGTVNVVGVGNVFCHLPH